MTGLDQGLFYIDPLAISVGVCITFFTVLTLLYSWGYNPFHRLGSGVGE
jgi:hypothetical protein